MMKIIGESLLYLVAFPIIAFQSIEMIDAFVQLMADMSEWSRMK